ncbi:WXG100 family type VII secretion target [Streptomyces sp. NPDC051636]|uniref:WXG100 family type VII secretion target n=1 Tax=Streptomyces sp. NPDC051636 TaxID=3365663 RepID=UPI003795BD9E
MDGHQGRQPDLKVSDSDLKQLADDLHAMQEHLDKQVRRMDALVDQVEAGWRGPAATAYREFHRAAAEDAIRIREVMELLETAVRLSRGGFSETELATLEKFRRIQVATDVESEVNKLSTPNPDAMAEPARPHSSFDSM